MPTAPDELVARQMRLKDTLGEQEHQLYRTTLPDDYRPGKGADPNLRPLRLSPVQVARLNGLILTTKLALLDIAEEIQIAMIGKADAWIADERAKLRAELRAIWL